MAQARKEGWPEDKYQCLCFNCNCGKATNKGICPHKSISKEEYLIDLNSKNFKVGREFVNTNTNNLDARVAGRKRQAKVHKMISKLTSEQLAILSSMLS